MPLAQLPGVRVTRPLTPAGAAATTVVATLDATALMAALATAGGHVGKAALALGVCRRTLDRRITALGLRAWLRGAYPKSAVMRAVRAAAPGASSKIDRTPENTTRL